MKSLFKWLKIATFSIVGLLLIIILTGFVYEQFMRFKANRQFNSLGKQIDIGLHKLNYLELGHGKPEVIFESGLDGGGFLTWSKVQPKVAKFASTLAYNRAGILWSERGNNPKTCDKMADELYFLLKKTNHKGPYILVGHSLAGYMLRSFIEKHPNEVAGIIFVDVAHPKQNNKTNLPPTSILNFLNSIGIARIISTNHQYSNTLFNEKFNIIARSFGYKSFPTVFEEYHCVEKLAAEADKINSFGNIPLYILTGTNEKMNLENMPKKFFNTKLEQQKSLLKLSTNSKQIMAKNSGHFIQFDEPDLVIEAIRQLVENNKN